MKTAKLMPFLVLLLVAYGAFTTLHAHQINKRMAVLEASRHQLEEKHRRLVEICRFSVNVMSLHEEALNEQASRRLIALLDSEKGSDFPAAPSEGSKFNMPPSMQTK